AAARAVVAVFEDRVAVDGARVGTVDDLGAVEGDPNLAEVDTLPRLRDEVEVARRVARRDVRIARGRHGAVRGRSFGGHGQAGAGADRGQGDLEVIGAVSRLCVDGEAAPARHRAGDISAFAVGDDGVAVAVIYVADLGLMDHDVAAPAHRRRE